MNNKKVMEIIENIELYEKNKHKSNILNVFSSNMKKLRKKANLTQEELSFRSGLHRNYISDSERGKRNLSIKSIEKIAWALNSNVWELFKLDE